MVLIFFCGRAGVEYTVIFPAQVTLAEGVRVGRGALLYPNNAVLGESEVGAGTVLSVLLTGPCIQFFSARLDRPRRPAPSGAPEFLRVLVCPRNRDWGR